MKGQELMSHSRSDLGARLDLLINWPDSQSRAEEVVRKGEEAGRLLSEMAG